MDIIIKNPLCIVKDSNNIPEGYIKPEGTLEVFDNGEYDVTQYEKVNVLIGVAGLYDENDILLASWDELVNEYRLELRDGNLANIISNNSQLSGARKFIIPDSVTIIEDLAFYNCTSLKSIEIPNSVTEIWPTAFYNCTSLESIEIPNSVTVIGVNAFTSCNSLKNITISESLTGIGICAFYDCWQLESINIPNGVTSILRGTFTNCWNLQSINIPNSVTSIGSEAFYDCYNLKSINIPNSVTSIGDSAFYGCDGLENITIPEGVTSIGEYAFYNCKSLTIYCEAESQPTGWNHEWNYSNCPVVWGATMPYTLKITENGRFDVTDYSDVKVNVPIPDGYIIPTGTKEIIDNGSYDVVQFANVEVNIDKGISEEEVQERINEALNSILEGDC